MTRLSNSPPAAPHPGVLQARFLAVVSHELRTPLTTIASFTESLDADDLPPPERSLALSAVRRNTERMLALVEDLMEVSRLQAGDLNLTLTEVDPAVLMQQAAESLAVHGLHTATTVDVTPGRTMLGDAALLRQLFYAVVGTVSSGAVDRSATVSTTSGDDRWTITVAARRSEQLTNESLMAGMLAMPEPPHRSRSTALWMLLADAIAARHGGSVELTFDAATGAGAVIELPCPPAARQS